MSFVNIIKVPLGGEHVHRTSIRGYYLVNKSVIRPLKVARPLVCRHK